MYFCDLNSEVEVLESTEDIDSAQATTATLHKAWLSVKSDKIGVQKGLSNLFSSGRAQKEKLEIEKRRTAREASKKYYKQGEPRTSDHQADLTLVNRFNISSCSISEATKPKTIPQLNPGPSSG